MSLSLHDDGAGWKSGECYWEEIVETENPENPKKSLHYRPQYFPLQHRDSKSGPL